MSSRSFRAFICIFIPLFVLPLNACRNAAYREFLDSLRGAGGGQDAIVVDLPFDSGFASQCVQGPGGDYSHNYTSTKYDADFDTPNNVHVPVFAPVAGKLRLHNDPWSDFGIHQNIGLGDGTYLNLSHLFVSVVPDNVEVAAGQLIGFEGSTGNSTGDHVHLGRHRGLAEEDAGRGVSVEGLQVRSGSSPGAAVATPLSDLDCGLYTGASYTSVLRTPRWHPNGSLVKHPLNPDVYLIEGGEKRHIADESVFWSLNYSFGTVANVSQAELDCYPTASPVSHQSEIRAVFTEGDVWLLIGRANDVSRKRYRVGNVGWKAVLESWGIHVEERDELKNDVLASQLDTYPDRGKALFRDGSLLVGIDSPTVYYVSDGIAMPIIDWDTYLLLGFLDRPIMVVEDGWIPAVMDRVGDCSTGVSCITPDIVLTCGGVGDVGIAGSDGDTGFSDGTDGTTDSGLLTETDDPNTTDTSTQPTGDTDSGTDDSTPTDTGLPPDTDVGSADTGQSCSRRTLTWKPDADLGDGEHLEYAADGELWVLETSNWVGNPADRESGQFDTLRMSLEACPGDVLTVNGTFFNWDAFPDSAGQWWMCADPWNPRYWGSFEIDGTTLTRQQGIDLYMVDVDQSGGPTPGDEVGCLITVP